MNQFEERYAAVVAQTVELIHKNELDESDTYSGTYCDLLEIYVWPYNSLLPNVVSMGLCNKRAKKAWNLKEKKKGGIRKVEVKATVVMSYGIEFIVSVNQSAESTLKTILNHYRGEMVYEILLYDRSYYGFFCDHMIPKERGFTWFNREKFKIIEIKKGDYISSFTEPNSDTNRYDLSNQRIVTDYGLRLSPGQQLEPGQTVTQKY